MSKLEDRKEALEAQFKALDVEKAKLMEQLNDINVEQLRLQGSYREIEALLAEESKPEPKGD